MQDQMVFHQLMEHQTERVTTSSVRVKLLAKPSEMKKAEGRTPVVKPYVLS